MIITQDNIEILLCLNHLLCVYKDKIKASNSLYLLYCSSAPISGYTHDIFIIFV